MRPARIYDQPISNGAILNELTTTHASWIREMADQEREHDPLPSSLPPLSPASSPACADPPCADLAGARRDAFTSGDPALVLDYLERLSGLPGVDFAVPRDGAEESLPSLMTRQAD